MPRIILFIVLFMSAASYASKITVNTDVLSDTTWAADTVLVESDINISNGVALTIGSGTQVLFSDHFKLTVSGTIYALGTENDSIVFSALDTSGFWQDYAQNTGSWSGIEFTQASQQADTSLFQHCVFKYAKATEVNDNAYGAVIYAVNAAPLTITNCSFRNNSAFNGGGAIYAKNTGLQLSNSNFINNNGYKNNGGAVYYFSYAEFNMQNCYFQNNNAYKGGAVYLLDIAETYIDHCEFYDNSAKKMSNVITDAYGAAISIYRSIYFSDPMYATITHNKIIGSRATSGSVYFEELVDAVIENNTFAYNIAGNTGAGIGHGTDCKLNVKNNIFANNQANSGAALYYYFSGAGLQLINNLFANNYSRDNYASAGGNGGGAVSINNSTDSVKIINNTFVHNRHNYMGGALHLIRSRNCQVINNIFYDNSAPHAPQIAINTKDATNDSLMYPDLKYNCIEDGMDSIGFYRKYGLVDYDSTYRGIYENNILDAPEFIQPSAGIGVAYAGLDADWSLLEYSPCINAGDPLFTTDSIGVGSDLAANPRIYLFDEIQIADIGAYEFQGIPGPNGLKSGKILPQTVTLYQNYPNPFNPQTVIRYTLADIGLVQIDVYNTLGQKIKTLLNKTQSAGSYSITFNASGLPSGIYYYQLRVDNHREMRKMVLLK